jgi:copper chaperone CopZ
MEQATKRLGNTSQASLPRNNASARDITKGEDQMIRRKFLGLMTLAGASSLATLKAATILEKKTVTYKISGFTCITCAVGLETLLQRENGIIAAKANYPDATATVTYDPKSISEASIVEAIESVGFHAQALHIS